MAKLSRDCAPLGDRRPRRLRKPTRPMQAVDIAQGAKAGEDHARAEFRRRLQALDKLLVLEATRGTGRTKTIGAVVIVGLDNLEPSHHEVIADDVAAIHQSIDQMLDATSGAEAHSLADFVERWRVALLAHMGFDDVQALGLPGSKAHHGSNP